MHVLVLHVYTAIARAEASGTTTSSFVVPLVVSLVVFVVVVIVVSVVVAIVIAVVFIKRRRVAHQPLNDTQHSAATDKKDIVV